MHVLIIGNGIAGVTCARYIRKNSNAQITIVSGESIDFFSRPALMYLYMGYMKMEHVLPYPKDFWSKNRIDRLQDWVTAIDFNSKVATLSSGQILNWDKLVLACGSAPRKLNCIGEELNGIQGFYHLKDLEQLADFTTKIKNAAIIGGGLIGVELAEMLRYKGKAVTFIIRESSFMRHVFPMEESEVIHNHIISHGVELLADRTVSKFYGDQVGFVNRIGLSDGSNLEADFAAVSIGVEPNIAWLENTNLGIGRGIKINRKFETSEKDVYAIGDCAEFIDPPPGHKPVESLWYTGKMHGIWAAHSVLGDSREFHPPIWFNSAKFFELEYQIYGHVPSDFQPESMFDSRLISDKDRIIRLVWSKQSGEITGIHGLGVRLRQNVCTEWIENKKNKDDALSALPSIIFDSEFSKRMA